MSVGEREALHLQLCSPAGANMLLGEKRLPSVKEGTGSYMPQVVPE